MCQIYVTLNALRRDEISLPEIRWQVFKYLLELLNCAQALELSESYRAELIFVDPANFNRAVTNLEMHHIVLRCCKFLYCDSFKRTLSRIARYSICIIISILIHENALITQLKTTDRKYSIDRYHLIKMNRQVIQKLSPPIFFVIIMFIAIENCGRAWKFKGMVGNKLQARSGVDSWPFHVSSHSNSTRRYDSIGNATLINYRADHDRRMLRATFLIHTARDASDKHERCIGVSKAYFVLIRPPDCH